MKKKKRLFIFIDESGDPGFPGNSDHFAYNIILLSSNGIEALTKELSTYRYFLDHFKELKNYTKNNEKILDFIKKIIKLHKITIKTFYIKKSNYVGPYKDKGEGIKFRNFILRYSLKKFFESYVSNNIDYDMENIPEWEIIIDRYLDSEDHEQNLKKYLQSSWDIFEFSRLVMVDSKYTPPIQVLDIVSEIIRPFFKGEVIKRKIPINIEIINLGTFKK